MSYGRPWSTEAHPHDDQPRDSNIPELIDEALVQADFAQREAEIATDAAELGISTIEGEQVPSEVSAIMAYHRWVITLYNRLRVYSGQIANDTAQKWWNDRTVNIETFRGQDHVVVTIGGGAIEVLSDILDQELEAGKTVRIRELVGLKSLIFVRRIETRIEVNTGTSRNPDATRVETKPDWLDLSTLRDCHDGLVEIAKDLFFESAAELEVKDQGPLDHGE